MLDTVRDLARPSAAEDAAAPVMRLDSEDDAAALVGWLAADRSRARVRLVIDDAPAGTLDRSAVLAALPTRVLGMGDSSRLELPGESSSRAWQFVELQCPEPACPERDVVAPAYDPAAPPHCRIHPERALQPRP